MGAHLCVRRHQVQLLLTEKKKESQERLLKRAAVISEQKLPSLPVPFCTASNEDQVKDMHEHPTLGNTLYEDSELNR